MFHTVSDKKYRILKLRNQKIIDGGYRGIDERMINTLRLLNNIDGIQTVWSCSGHTIVEQYQKWLNAPANNKREEFLEPRNDAFYFIFAAGRNADPFFNFLSKLLKESGFHGYSLAAKTLNWCFNEDGSPNFNAPPGFQVYPVWEFGFIYRVKDHGAYLEKIESLNARIEDFLYEQGVGRIVHVR